MTFEIAKIEIKDSEVKKRVTALFAPPKKRAGSLFTTEVADNKLDYISIYQPTTTSVEAKDIYQGMNMGDMYSRKGLIGNNVTMIPLVMWGSRNYFDKNLKKSVCRSPDGEIPVHDRISKKCEGCPKARYSKGNPSSCAEGINILAIPADFSSRPVVFQFSKTSYQVGKNIALQANQFGDEVYDSCFSLETQRADGKAYFVYKIARVAETKKKFRPLLKALQDHFSEDITKRITRHRADLTVSTEVQKIDALDDID